MRELVQGTVDVVAAKEGRDRRPARVALAAVQLVTFRRFHPEAVRQHRQGRSVHVFQRVVRMPSARTVAVGWVEHALQEERLLQNRGWRRLQAKLVEFALDRRPALVTVDDAPEELAGHGLRCIGHRPRALQRDVAPMAFLPVGLIALVAHGSSLQRQRSQVSRLQQLPVAGGSGCSRHSPNDSLRRSRSAPIEGHPAILSRLANTADDLLEVPCESQALGTAASPFLRVVRIGGAAGQVQPLRSVVPASVDRVAVHLPATLPSPSSRCRRSSVCQPLPSTSRRATASQS